jgi:hypothetical protein
VSLALRLVVDAAITLRGCAAAMGQFAALGWTTQTMPCYSTVRAWILRIGLHALTRPLDKKEPWIWLVDHTVQIGQIKLLVILGCPMSQVPFGERALRMSDLTLVALVPMEKSNGRLIETEMENAAYRTGRPASIATDQGGDLLKGIADYRELRPEVAHVPDIAHFGANALEHAWDGDPRWAEFVGKLQETSSKLRQSKEAYLMAPRMRPKARFMNVRTQMRFAERVLKHLDQQTPHAKAIEHYGWLNDFRVELSVWFREHHLVQTTIEKLRVDGLHAESLPELESAWGEIGERPSTVAVVEKLRGYVRDNQPKVAGMRLVASTEILESSFGKLKRMEGQQSQDGITAMALALGAAVGHWDEDAIREALESVPEKKVESTAQRLFGGTVQWFRKQFFAGKSA